MSYRCINAFQFGELTYPGGCEVDDSDPILQSHKTFFAQVDRPVAIRATETASAAPAELREHERPRRGRSRKQSPEVEPVDDSTAPEAPTPDQTPEED